MGKSAPIQAPRLKESVRGAKLFPGFLAVSFTILLLVVAIYGQTARHGFVDIDDPLYVTDNAAVREGLTVDGARWALSTFHAANWHPLTWLSLMIDGSLFQARPGPIHLVSAGIHAVGALACFAALVRLTGATGPALLAGLLLAAHPLHVESVAWVSQRKDVLAGLFFWLALLVWAGYLRRPGAGRYLGAVGLCAASLAAKPTGVAFPIVLLVLDRWPLGRWRAGRRWQLVREKIPFLFLSLGAGAVTLMAQMAGGAVDSLQNTPPLYRLTNATVAIATYLRRSLWPADLAFYYPLPQQGWSIVVAGTAGVAVLGIAAALWAWRRRAPALAAGGLIFTLLLLPTLGLLRVGSQALADRYVYLGLPWLWAGIAWTAVGAIRGRPRLRRAALAAGCAAVLILAWRAQVQAGFWRDSETLYRRALAVTGPNSLVEYDLGNVLAALGQHAEAIEHYRRALAIDPADSSPRFNLGNSLLRLERYPEAAEAFRQITARYPDDKEAWFNRGEAERRMGRWEQAEVSFRRAIGAGKRGGGRRGE